MSSPGVPAPETVVRLLDEGPISVAQAAEMNPSARGKRRYASTVTRWIVEGMGGVRLEGYAGPDGTWWTSKQALGRFLAATTAAELGEQPLESEDVEKVEREARAAAAMERLAAMKKVTRKG